MQRNATSGTVKRARIAAFFLGSATIVALAIYLSPTVLAQDAGGGDNKKIAELIALGHKFLGSTSCKSCHGEAAADPGAPVKKGSEYTMWSTVDKHHTSFTTLQGDQSKAIASKGGYGDPTSSTKCLACHSLNVPAAQQGPDFKTAEGNTCDACHGPAELWSGADGSPHKNTGWAQKRRDADGFDAKKQAVVDGFWDVRNPVLRAENCASCHLAIDTKMIAAGHPQPAFEVTEYAAQEPKHWTDKRSDQYFAQIWASGQVVCAREAMTQLASRAAAGDPADAIKSAYNQAMAHATMLQILATTDGGVGSEIKDDLAKAMGDLTASGGTDAAKIKDAATAVAALADKVATTDLAGFAPAATDTAAILAKVIAQSDDLAKNYDRRGAEQAAYAARWLYLSKAWDDKPKTEFPDDLTAAYKGFFDARANPLGDDAAKFADAIGKIKALP